MAIQQKLKHFTILVALISVFSMALCSEVFAKDIDSKKFFYDNICPQNQISSQKKGFIRIRNDTPITPNVYPSCPEEADAYYALISSADELDYPAGKQGDSLDELLKYFGYEGLKAEAIENISSNVLMPVDNNEFGKLVEAVKTIDSSSDFENRFTLNDFTDDKVLVTGFFAPKITDASTVTNQPGQQRKFGWRKLVRLRTKPGSKASEKKIESLHLLFNLFATVEQDPFNPPNSVGRSQNTQAILVRGEGSALKNSVYWLDYGPISKGGQPVNFLGATFDYRDPNLNGGSPGQAQKYFLPGACAECHGVKRPQDRTNLIFPDGKLNYLDTDHWFDRSQPDNDFPEIGNSSFGVLFDGGKDQSSQKFTKAFEVIRKINTEILAQNKLAGEPNSFQVRAAENWLELHANGVDTNFPPIDRALPPASPGGSQWIKGNSVDEALLPKLNQFCFRCHSSLIYHVFDKDAVKERASFIEFLMSPGELQGKPIVPQMPQDRVLDEETRKTIRDFQAKKCSGITV
jgi:hypothetical protein